MASGCRAGSAGGSEQAFGCRKKVRRGPQSANEGQGKASLPSYPIILAGHRSLRLTNEAVMGTFSSGSYAPGAHRPKRVANDSTDHKTCKLAAPSSQTKAADSALKRLQTSSPETTQDQEPEAI